MSQLSVKDCAELAGLGDIGIRKLTRFVRLLNQHGRLNDGSVLYSRPLRLGKIHMRMRREIAQIIEKWEEEERAEKQP